MSECADLERDPSAIKSTTVPLGTLVWAKLDPWPWWPGVVVSNSMCGLPPPKKADSFWIFWLGHRSVSEVPTGRFRSFLGGWPELGDPLGADPRRDAAVLEGLRALAFVLEPAAAQRPPAKLRLWAARHVKIHGKRQVRLALLPDWLERSLVKIQRTNAGLKKIAREKEVRSLSMFQKRAKSKKAKPATGWKEEPVDQVLAPRDNDIAIVERVHRGTLDLESLCIGCHREVMGISHQHPLFRGALCAVCLVEIQETSYAIAEDEIRVGCAVCGSTGDCLVCDRDACCRVYCPYCIELLVGEGARQRLVNQSPWWCFLCTGYAAETHGLLQPRADWPKRLRLLLHPRLPATWSQLIRFRPRQLRVVALHDGIAAVHFALHDLGIDVSDYYVWQRWDELCDFNDAHRVRMLGKADEWREERWARLAPVHLLVCCLPLRTVAEEVGAPLQPTGADAGIAASGQRRKMPRVGRATFRDRDAGKAFYDFYDIKGAIERNNQGRTLLWAVESVACYSLTISRFLEMEPVVFDLKDSQGSSSARYVWTNLPDQDFQPNLDDIYERYHGWNAGASGRVAAEPLLQKYPWIAQDLEAIRQPLPLDFFRRKQELDRQSMRPETRSLTRQLCAGLPSPSLTHYSLVSLAQRSKSKARRMVLDQGWKPHEGSSDDEDLHFGGGSDRQPSAEALDAESYAEFLGFPSHFAHFLGRLEAHHVLPRLNRSLPVTLWKHLMKPLQKLVLPVGAED